MLVDNSQCEVHRPITTTEWYEIQHSHNKEMSQSSYEIITFNPVHLFSQVVWSRPQPLNVQIRTSTKETDSYN